MDKIIILQVEWRQLGCHLYAVPLVSPQIAISLRGGRPYVFGPWVLSLNILYSNEEILGPLMSGGAGFLVHIFPSSLVEVRCCVTLRSDIFLPPWSYSFGV
ncbi:hypothetical protein RHMOL_Rhmol05G0020000 [Rhododendron molle]|uniref:Uncharacterized protein n=1 Tax=Rhododendron molle TaxID=49168 RepID=A0ACC0NLX5_RHOML|nr:hypothetical protein RHMOL_Rhmol05G0020000 [Rhododendron molle]